MLANTLSKHPRFDSRIVEALAQGTPLSIQELTKHLHHKREDAVNIALKALILRGQVQRVGLSHRYRLSPT